MTQEIHDHGEFDRCVNCRYSLRGLIGNVCPECGQCLGRKEIEAWFAQHRRRANLVLAASATWFGLYLYSDDILAGAVDRVNLNGIEVALLPFLAIPIFLALVLIVLSSSRRTNAQAVAINRVSVRLLIFWMTGHTLISIATLYR